MTSDDRFSWISRNWYAIRALATTSARSTRCFSNTSFRVSFRGYLPPWLQRHLLIRYKKRDMKLRHWFRILIWALNSLKLIKQQRQMESHCKIPNQRRLCWTHPFRRWWKSPSARTPTASTTQRICAPPVIVSTGGTRQPGLAHTETAFSTRWACVRLATSPTTTNAKSPQLSRQRRKPSLRCQMLGPTSTKTRTKIAPLLMMNPQLLSEAAAYIT